MSKSALVMMKAAAVCGLFVLCSAFNADAVGQENDSDAAKKRLGAATSVHVLKDGRTVPAQNSDGRPVTRSSSGGVIYGRGVYVTKEGAVHLHGKVVRELAPGESLSIEELEGLTKDRPMTSRRPQRDVSSNPPAGRSNAPGSRADYPNASAPSTSAAVSNPGGMGPAPRTQGAQAAPIKPGETGAQAAAVPGQSSRGDDVFVLGNGTQVPSDLGGGVTGSPDGSGGVGYSDGRSAHVDPATGDTVFSNPDGSEASRYTPATEGMGTTADGSPTETFVMPNGNHVPREQGGGTGVANDSGGVNYPDGSYTEYDPDTGETVFFDNDGQEIDRAGSQQAYPSTTDDGGSIYVMTNGQTVPRTGPDGQRGTPNGSGGVDYEGGVSTNPTDDGRTVVTGSPNGGYIAVETSSDENGNATFDLGNGTSVPASGDGGNGRITDGGAGVEFEDGTFVSVGAKTGDTVFQYPDGSSEVMHGENNRKDAANYVYVTSGGSSDGGSSNSSGGKDKDDTTGSKNRDSNSGDDKGNKDKDKDKDDDADDDSDDSSDDKGDGGDSKDDGKDSDDKEGADKNLGTDGDAGNDPEGKKTVDDALARKTGDKKEPDSTGPATCSEGRGGPPGGVAEPGSGQQNCVPAGLQPGQDDEEDSEPAPVLNSPMGNSLKRDALRPEDRVGQPGIGGDRISNDGRTLENKLEDIEGVVNPHNR